MLTPDQRLLLDVPTRFVSERLDFRAVQPGDGAALNTAIAESARELAEWMPWARPTPTPEQTELWVRQAHAKFHAREEFHYLLILRGTSTIVGDVGFHRIVWSVPLFEMGYWLRTSHTGRGLMTEAASAFTNFGFGTFGAQRIEIRCDARNTRSAAVARRAGYVLEGTLRHDSRDADNVLRDSHVFARLRPTP